MSFSAMLRPAIVTRRGRSSFFSHSRVENVWGKVRPGRPKKQGRVTVINQLPLILQKHGGSEDPVREDLVGKHLRKDRETWSWKERKLESKIVSKACQTIEGTDAPVPCHELFLNPSCESLHRNKDRVSSENLTNKSWFS